MTIVLGALLSAGVLLVLAPWLWPAGVGAWQPEQSGGSGRLVRAMEAAGLGHLPPRVIIVLCIFSALAAAAIAWLATSIPVLAVVASVVGGSWPILWLRARRLSRQKARRGLWPDVCDLLIASVRAGMSLPDAVSTLSGSAPAQLRAPFAAFARDMAASGHFDSSVDRLKSALADPLGDRIIETLRMARQVGGTELTPVLRSLSASVRADAALRAEVEARQSWIRGAAVLGVIAPWAILAMLAMRPEGAEAYTSPEGVVLILVGAALSFVAFRIMLRIGRLPEPRRWFG